MKFVKIKKIEKTETEPIYHLNVENNHNFFGNNLCLHNCDYYGNTDNDGNIAMALYNYGSHAIILKKGDKVAQGIIENYLVCDDDNIEEIRGGGIGSTGK